MGTSFKEALKHRRSYYAIGNQTIVERQKIEEMIVFALKNVPSAFNSQSTRIVLLMGSAHKKLWQIVKDTLKKRIPAEAYVKTEEKIDNCFASGYGTVLFLEDRSVVEHLQEQFPTYSDRFPVWSQHTSAMHQLTMWTMLEDAGLGASLQHYNPLIDEEVHKEWNLPAQWELVAQMPFGNPLAEPDKKAHNSLAERMFVFE